MLRSSTAVGRTGLAASIRPLGRSRSCGLDEVDLKDFGGGAASSSQWVGGLARGRLGTGWTDDWKRLEATTRFPVLESLMN